MASLVSVANQAAAADADRLNSSLMEQLMMSYSSFVPCPVCQLLCPSKPHLILHLRTTHAELLAGMMGGSGNDGRGYQPEEREEEEEEEESVRGEVTVKEERRSSIGEASSSSPSSASYSCFDCR
jgi:hypothetical protein